MEKYLIAQRPPNDGPGLHNVSYKTEEAVVQWSSVHEQAVVVCVVLLDKLS
jgi:hypothetical protein